MTIRYCCECSEEYHTDKGFDIEIFNGSIFWCFECANKQLEIVDLKIKKMTSKDKTHKRVRFKTSKGYVSFKVRKSKQEEAKSK